MFRQVHQVVAQGEESAITDCILFGYEIYIFYVTVLGQFNKLDIFIDYLIVLRFNLSVICLN